MSMKLPIIKHQSAEDLLSALKADRVHAIVSDPPAGWGYQNREWDKHKGELLEGYMRDLQAEYGLDKRQARKLMLDWVPPVWVLWFRDIAKRMKRVLVPGGWVLIWTTPRMAHWTGMALEMAGFEIRDSIAWIYGQGMPKNANVSWLVDRELGYERGSQSPAITEQALRAAAVGTALCPGREDFILARKPLGTTQAKAWLDGERGALSIDATRFSEDARWPKNTLLSPNLHEALGDKLRLFYCPKVKTGSRETEAGCENLTLSTAAEMTLRRPGTAGLKNGRAGRGRSSQGARNDHPCLKPIALCRYLVRLVTQPGQIVCDPFSGSGSISIAAMMEGRRAVACDLEERYVEIGNARAKYWFDQGAPPPLYLRDPSGPEPAPRPGKDELLRVKVRTTQAMQDVIDRWPDPISPTIRAALDHYFGVIRDPGGPVIPAGYLEGFEDSRPTPGAPQSVDLFRDQAEAVAGASNPTIRTALRLWLGLAPHKQDDQKRVSRASLRIKG